MFLDSNPHFKTILQDCGSFMKTIKVHFDNLYGSDFEHRIKTLYMWGGVPTGCANDYSWIEFWYDGCFYRTQFLDTNMETTIKNSFKL